MREEETVVQEEFHDFKENFPNSIGLQITTNNFSGIEYHQAFRFRLEPYLFDDLQSPQEPRRYVYKCYFGSESSLSVLFDELDANIDLYDTMLAEIFEAFQLMYEYPKSIFRFLYVKVDKRQKNYDGN